MKKLMTMLSVVMDMLKGVDEMDRLDKEHRAGKKKARELKPILTWIRKISWLDMFNTGWGNGYVAVYKDRARLTEMEAGSLFSVHGGITLCCRLDQCSEKNRGKYVYFPDIVSGRSDWMIYGFDCAHYGDTSINCTEAFVCSETESLARQAAERCKPL